MQEINERSSIRAGSKTVFLQPARVKRVVSHNYLRDPGKESTGWLFDFVRRAAYTALRPASSGISLLRY